MRNVLFFLIFSMMSLSAGSAPVSQEQALRIARDFCWQRTQVSVRASGFQPQSSPVYVCYRKTATTVRSAGNRQVCYYVFNIEGNNGFVMVAGDDRARKVLAYGNVGTFNPENLPQPCAGWLQGYEAEMSALLEHPDVQPVSVVASTRFSITPVAPMLKSRWGQTSPYNLSCPTDGKAGNGARCVVGCTATAAAQIMYYHKYPERPSGAVDYYDSAQEVQRFMDFDTRPAFDWANMLPAYAGVEATDMQCQAVAGLMECVGHAAHMAYSSGTSISYHKTAAEALFTYFGYDRNMRRYERTYLTEQEWTDILTEELQAGRPVFYDGRNTGGGHSFVCDGYDGNGMFHFNWGWEGMADGYYVLSALAPEMQGVGGTNGDYTFAQVMECGIRPPSPESRPQDDPLVMTAVYTMDRDQKFEMNGTLVAGRTEQAGFYLYCRNIGHTMFRGDLCVAIETGNSLLTVGEPESVQVAADGSNVGRSWWLRLDGLSEGTYKASFYSRMAGNDNWVRLSAGQRSCSDYRITVTSASVTLEPLQPVVRVRIDDALSFTPLYAGFVKNVSFPIYNEGDVRLDGPVGLYLRTADSGEVLGIFSHRVFCEPGESTDVPVSINLEGYPAGDYQLVPFYCSATAWNAEPVEGNLIQVGDAIPVSVTAMPQIIIEADAGGYVLDKKTGTVSVSLFQPSSLRPWKGRVEARVYRKGIVSGAQGEDTGLRLYSEEMEMLKPSSKTCMLYAEDIALPVGNGYEIVFYLDNGYDMPLYAGNLTIVDTGTDVSEQKLSGLNLTWNSGRSELHIVSDSPLRSLSFFSLSGRIQLELRCGGMERTVEAGMLPSGLYLLKTETEKGSDVRKILIP